MQSINVIIIKLHEIPLPPISAPTPTMIRYDKARRTGWLVGIQS